MGYTEGACMCTCMCVCVCFCAAMVSIGAKSQGVCKCESACSKGPASACSKGPASAFAGVFVIACVCVCEHAAIAIGVRAKLQAVCKHKSVCSKGALQGQMQE